MVDHNCESCRPPCRERWRKIQDLLIGHSILDIGCAHGDGCEFVPYGMQYTGIDINTKGVPYGDEYWPKFIVENPMREFREVDLRIFMKRTMQWDTIVVLEMLEHIPDGIEWAYRLKEHCDRLIISVPENKEGHGEINNGHVLMNLQAKDFGGFVRLDELCDQYSMFLMWDRNPK